MQRMPCNARLDIPIDLAGATRAATGTERRPIISLQSSECRPSVFALGLLFFQSACRSAIGGHRESRGVKSESAPSRQPNAHAWRRLPGANSINALSCCSLDQEEGRVYSASPLNYSVQFVATSSAQD